MNYFIEGLQGAGKSTLLQNLSEKLQDHSVFREGQCFFIAFFSVKCHLIEINVLPLHAEKNDWFDEGKAE